MDTLLRESEEGTGIDFPIKINMSMFRVLCKYFILQSDGKNEVILNYNRIESFGNIHTETPPQTLEEVVSQIRNESISGVIRSRTFNSASFSLREDYHEALGKTYTGLDFEVTPGYEPGQLSSDNINLMREFGRTAYDFFHTLEIKNEDTE